MRDPFAQIVLHEDRHIWQYTYATLNGAPDADADFVVPPPATPSSAPELSDARYGSNPEFDFYTDSIQDLNSWGQVLSPPNLPFPRVPFEVDAIRTSAALVGVTPGCADTATFPTNYTLTLSTVRVGTPPTTGTEIRASVTFTNRYGTTTSPYEGATVLFAAPAPILSEIVPEFIPALPSGSASPLLGCITSGTSQTCNLQIVSRARYTDFGNPSAGADARAFVPDAAGHSGTTVTVTLKLPPECGAAGVKDVVQTINVP